MSSGKYFGPSGSLCASCASSSAKPSPVFALIGMIASYPASEKDAISASRRSFGTKSILFSANTFGSDYDTVLSAYTGEPGALTLVPGACNDDTLGLQSHISFEAAAGVTHYFLIGICCGFGGSAYFSLYAS